MRAALLALACALSFAAAAQDRDREKEREANQNLIPALGALDRGDVKQAIDTLRPLAANGDIEAAYVLATVLETSKPPNQDLAAAKASHEGGVAIVVTSRFAIFKHAWSDTADNPLIQVPPEGFERVKTSRFYAAYVRCP